MTKSGAIVLLASLIPYFAPASENPLRIELVSESASIQPGHPFRVALHLQHPHGYHTYWKFSGIVGVPTGMKWNLPEGWTAEEIEWPEPERVFMFQIKAQGLHDEKLLPIRITPPQNLQPGKMVKLEGTATWMCCGRDCNPGFQNLSIEIPVTAHAGPPDARWSAMFAESSASVARESRDWLTEAKRNKDSIILHVKPVSERARLHLRRIEAVTFFTEDGLVDPNRPESVINTGSEIVLTQTISKFAPEPLPSKLQGILQTPQGWLPDHKPTSIRIATAIRN